VGQDVILADIGSGCDRLLDVFRRRGRTHEAWKTLIVSGKTKGSYRLSGPLE
jgi:hypothetical protein